VNSQWIKATASDSGGDCVELRRHGDAVEVSAADPGRYETPSRPDARGTRSQQPPYDMVGAGEGGLAPLRPPRHE